MLFLDLKLKNLRKKFKSSLQILGDKIDSETEGGYQAAFRAKEARDEEAHKKSAADGHGCCLISWEIKQSA